MRTGSGAGANSSTRRRIGTAAVGVLLATGRSIGGPSSNPPAPASGPAPAAGETCTAGQQRSQECLILGILGASSSEVDQDSKRIREAQAAFWARVNAEGGIDGVRVRLRPASESRNEAMAFLAASEVVPPPLEELPDLAAVRRVVEREPDVIALGVKPGQTEAIVVQAVQDGYGGKFGTTSPGWDASLNDGVAADLLADRLVVAARWRAFDTGSRGHGAMRTALGDVQPDDAYTAGWAGNYPLLSLLREAAEARELTRSGLRNAAVSLDEVDWDGLLPPATGDVFAGDPRAQEAKRTVFAVPDSSAPTGTTDVEDFFNVLAASARPYERPCYAELDEGVAIKCANMQPWPETTLRPPRKAGPA